MPETILYENFYLPVSFTTAIFYGQIPDFQWAKNYQAYSNSGCAISVDALGNSDMTGFFEEPSITVGTETFQNTGIGDTYDIYIVKNDAAGNILFSKHHGSTGFDMIMSVDNDQQGNLISAGTFTETMAFDDVILSPIEGRSGFLVKYDAAGNVLWARKPVQTPEAFWPYEITIDATGNIYLVGLYHGPELAIGNITLINDSFEDEPNASQPFVAKYDADGNPLWARSAKRIGQSPFPNIPYDVSVDNIGNVFIGGCFFTDGIEFGDITLTKNGDALSSNIFMVKYDADGDVLWAKTAQSAMPNNSVHAIATDELGNSYFGGLVTGETTFENESINMGFGSKMFMGET